MCIIQDQCFLGNQSVIWEQGVTGIGLLFRISFLGDQCVILDACVIGDQYFNQDQWDSVGLCVTLEQCVLCYSGSVCYRGWNSGFGQSIWFALFPLFFF